MASQLIGPVLRKPKLRKQKGRVVAGWGRREKRREFLTSRLSPAKVLEKRFKKKKIYLLTKRRKMSAKGKLCISRAKPPKKEIAAC